MGSEALAALRAELNTALAILLPQIRGLEDLINVSLTDDVKTLLRQELDDRTRRRGLIETALSSLDELENDTYPEMRKEEVTTVIFDELQGQRADFEAAFGEFVKANPMASKIEIDLVAVDKTPTT